MEIYESVFLYKLTEVRHMKVALINENSQAGKNGLIFRTLKDVAEPMGHTVYNYGRYSEEDGYQRTYVQAGLLAGILLNSGAADFVITGCGTGMGAMLACNSFPNVFCGLIDEPLDGYLFTQVNAGNAISLPFAKAFGWGSEVKLRYTFERVFAEQPGGGYPKEWAAAEQTNREILQDVKKITCNPMEDILQRIDREFLKATLMVEGFEEQFYENCRDERMAELIRELLK